ncbi:MAG: polyprenyl synthetase family protein [Candidatus Marinimicrobia bacterium]|nr:polyprenyl synthetase family protein [Candidatus Neomarinimicrobiota bacterium]MBT3576205.1 polyprenyl synthetase family protein [Candidatus Neomarinimicrobiota bacterium]MBT3679240.1 polyprenyl synthetase family protein [Candidatus Neomarinimicrobiota bacterium]MBT3949734.1 polyprenyl synthetase family protein [Candidatus Neomarinimicrobiota bacterium]MBT4254066.1 polyprenyl synthetase family protein [Candidatus Neomarinimicrobiota bacterium]
MDIDVKARIEAWRMAISQHLHNPSFHSEPVYLSEPMNYALRAEGKMLRPALCLAAAEAVGGDWHDAVTVGAALEIFHTFTLVHDDIMDGDELRRGIPTLHKAFGDNRALLSGDTLLIYVYQLLADIGESKFTCVFRAFNDGAMDVCRGQGWDMEFENSDHVEPQQYEMMIDLKTGALIRLACHLGGIMGGGSDAAIEALSRFGTLLGRAFQMQDDLLEVTSSSATMGKSLGSDVLNEKKTWIWIDLKSRLTESELKEWQNVQNGGELAEHHRDQVKQWMIDHGTIKRAQDLIASWISEADSLLSSSLFKNTAMLKVLSDIILNRQN